MGFFEGFLSIGILIGNISSSYIFYATNYPTVFAVSAACSILSLILTIFFITESLENKESEGQLKGFFEISNITDMLKTSFKKRQHYDRCTVLCCIFCLSLYIFTINGEGSIIFLYLREKFQWSLEKYTLYSAFHNIAWIIGTMFGVFILQKVLRIPETILIFVGFVSMFNGALMIGLANTDWSIYGGFKNYFIN